MSFTFNPQEEWSPRGGVLPKGDHVCAITDIDAEQTDRNGHPMVIVTTGNEDGEIRNWIAIMTLDNGSNTFGKITNLVLSAEVPEANWPKPGVDFDPNTGKLSQEYCDKNLYGRKIGVVVREKPDERPGPSYGRMQSRVSGYVKPGEVHAGTSTDTPIDTGGLPAAQPSFAGVGASQQPGEPTIPF